MESTRKPIKHARKKLEDTDWWRLCFVKCERREAVPNKLGRPQAKQRIQQQINVNEEASQQACGETASETKESNNKQRTKHACLVGSAMNPRGKRLESTLPKDHEAHIAEIGFNPASHYNMVHSDASSDEKFWMRKQQWIRNGREARNDSSLAIGQSEEQGTGLFCKHKETTRSTLLTLLH